MARSWHYPRWKRIALSVLMVFILASTLGLAEVVVHHQAKARRNTLAGPTKMGQLYFHPPADWVVLPNVKPEELVIQEPGNMNRRARTLILKAVTEDSPEKVIESIRIKYPNYTDWVPPDQIEIAGKHGIIVALCDQIDFTPDGNHQTIWVATAPIAPGRQVVVQMVCPDDQDQEWDRSQFVAVIESFTASK